MNKKYNYDVLGNAIEFLDYPHDDPLLFLIYSVLEQIGVKKLSLDNLFTYNENDGDIVFIEDSVLGRIEIRKNSWGDIFIFPKENKQKIVEEIDKLLEKSGMFQRRY